MTWQEMQREANRLHKRANWSMGVALVVVAVDMVTVFGDGPGWAVVSLSVTGMLLLIVAMRSEWVGYWLGRRARYLRLEEWERRDA